MNLSWIINFVGEKNLLIALASMYKSIHYPINRRVYASNVTLLDIRANAKNIVIHIRNLSQSNQSHVWYIYGPDQKSCLEAKMLLFFVYVIVKRPIQHLVDSSLRGVSSRAQTFVHKQREWKWSQPVHSLSHSSRSFPVVLLNKLYTCINLIRMQTLETFYIISGW